MTAGLAIFFTYFRSFHHPNASRIWGVFLTMSWTPQANHLHLKTGRIFLQIATFRHKV